MSVIGKCFLLCTRRPLKLNKGLEIIKQTLAIEDMDLYTAKQFAYGKAKDDKAAAFLGLKSEHYPKRCSCFTANLNMFFERSAYRFS